MKKSGFSLMEVLTVIAILSIIAVMTIPNVSSWMRQYNLVKAARDLRSNLQAARVSAIKDRREYIIQTSACTGDSGAYKYLIFKDCSKNRVCNEDECGAGANGKMQLHFAEGYFGKGVYIDAANTNLACSAAGMNYGFSPRGTSILDSQASATKGYITLTRDTEAGAKTDYWVVLLNSSGVVTIKKNEPALGGFDCSYPELY